jgi:hypothetical protein
MKGLGTKLENLLTQYGATAFVTWFVIFGLVFAGFAVAIKSGFQVESGAGSAGTLGAAYVATQLTKPIRIAATLVLTPVVARVVKRLRGKPSA